jgi:hypothetical protein
MRAPPPDAIDVEIILAGLVNAAAWSTAGKLCEAVRRLLGRALLQILYT